jgi:hypothetical protein
MGAWKARVAMSVIDPGDAKLAKWMDRLVPVTVDPAQREAYVTERLQSVRQAVTNVEAGQADFIVMKAADGK